MKYVYRTFLIVLLPFVLSIAFFGTLYWQIGRAFRNAFLELLTEVDIFMCGPIAFTHIV
jgi:hypothetical protein